MQFRFRMVLIITTKLPGTDCIYHVSAAMSRSFYQTLYFSKYQIQQDKNFYYHNSIK